MATAQLDRLTGLSTGSAVKAPCLVATTANILLTGEQTIDGTLTSESRVLVKDQTVQSENGIYVSSTGAWTRAPDFTSNDEVAKGTRVYVTDGVAGEGEYKVTTNDPITLDTSNIVFELVAVAGADGADGITASVVAGTNVSVDDTDPANPIVSAMAPYTPASASAAAKLEFAEDTDNGVHKITVAAPASIASDKTLTFPDVTGTFYVSGGADVAVADGGTNISAYAAGDILYASNTTVLSKLAKGAAGQVLAMNAGATAPEWADVLTFETAVATTSGTFIDFTDIPDGTRLIKVMFTGLSTNGTSNMTMLLGTSAGLENTGYDGRMLRAGAGGPVYGTISTSFVLQNSVVAATLYYGVYELVLMDAATNTWMISGSQSSNDDNRMSFITGSKALVGTLDRLRLTTVNGTDTFDAGLANIMYRR
jgi:hypothetical protein